nr:MAG TPA: hypothetical protein [Caudoviricetes sp.]
MTWTSGITEDKAQAEIILVQRERPRRVNTFIVKRWSVLYRKYAYKRYRARRNRNDLAICYCL